MVPNSVIFVLLQRCIDNFQIFEFILLIMLSKKSMKPKVNQKRLNSSSSMIEELDAEKRRRIEAKDKDPAEENGEYFIEESENEHYDFEESPLTNSIQYDIISSSSSSSVAATPVESSSKPPCPNYSGASSITRSENSTDSTNSTILLEDHIDSKHLEIGLFQLFMNSEIKFNSFF